MNQIPIDQPIELLVKVQDVQVILQGLSQLPYYAVAELIHKIQMQTETQQMLYMNNKLSAEQAESEKTPDPA